MRWCDYGKNVNPEDVVFLLWSVSQKSKTGHSQKEGQDRLTTEQYLEKPHLPYELI